MKKYNVAVVGATGLVGSKILEIMAERNFPVKNLYSPFLSLALYMALAYDSPEWISLYKRKKSSMLSGWI